MYCHQSLPVSLLSAVVGGGRAVIWLYCELRIYLITVNCACVSVVIIASSAPRKLDYGGEKELQPLLTFQRQCRGRTPP